MMTINLAALKVGWKVDKELEHSFNGAIEPVGTTLF